MLFRFFRKKSSADRALIDRHFAPPLFKDAEHQRTFNTYGYVHLKNVLTQDEISALTALYQEARSMQGFQNTDYYINTIGFENSDIRLFLKGKTEQLLAPVLPRFIDTEKADFPLGGGFCINPPHSSRGCSPHQDPTCVDELSSYSMTAWITLNDMTPKNGCMHVIPGSHRWGNIYRSVCVPWAFEKHSDYLWNYLTPVPTKAGDILCFDVSTIHASTCNTTDQTRLAMTVQTIPKEFGLISYFPNGKEKVDVYAIDRDYFIRESQYQKPSSRYPVTRTVRLNNIFTQSDIDRLHDLFQQQTSS